jgi:DNA-binding transcriptional LysR family regulator
MMGFDWNQASAFWTTAEAGSLSAAARRLGLTQPTLSRQLAALEDSLGVVLFERIGRTLILTEGGLDLLEHVRTMGAAAENMALGASGRAETAAGRVSISASDGFSTYLMPIVAERMRAEAPQITLEIVASNAISDLRRREADIALRHVRPEQPDLISKLVRETTAHLYASRSWIERNGMPEKPEDIADADFIGYDPDGRFIEFLRAQGVPVSADSFRLISENSAVMWEMAKRGLGVSAQVREVAALTPDMVQIFPELAPVPVPMWLVTHRELRTSRRIRLVFDILADELGRL